MLPRDGGAPPRSRDKQLRVAIAVAGAVVLLVVAVFLIVRARDDGGANVAAQSPTTTSTGAPATTVGTAPATTAPPGTATATPPQGKALDATGAFLVLVPQPTVQSTEMPTAKCGTLADTGWNIECGEVDMAGGQRVWLVEKKGVSPAMLWRARVVHWSQGKGAWLVDLAFTNENVGPGKQPGLDLTSIKVKAADLTGDGKSEVVFGFRSSGTGAYLGYDIVTDSAGSGPAVAASRQGLAKGQAAVVPGTVTEYAAAYPGGEPQCCPDHFDKAVVQFSGGIFRLIPTGPVAAPGPGQLDL